MGDLTEQNREMNKSRPNYFLYTLVTIVVFVLVIFAGELCGNKFIKKDAELEITDLQETKTMSNCSNFAKCPEKYSVESIKGGIAENLQHKLRHCSNVSTIDDVELTSYIAAWANMNEILQAMGSIFKFVSSEIDSKVKILNQIYHKKCYESIAHMMEREVACNLIDYEKLDESHPSGSRTLLRLHRAMKMVSLILRKVASDDYGEDLSTIVSEAYNGSPMPATHPWILRTTINTAVKWLPTTTSFTDDIAPGVLKQTLMPILAESADILDEIYTKTETLFNKNNLQDIP